MHTIWKGAITFGLVYVPVKMYAATEEKDIALKYLHRACGSSLSNVRTCPCCEKEVDWDDIVKGYEYEQGKFVRFEKEELEQLMPDAGKQIRILSFVDPQEIDPIYYQKTYYLSPGETGANAYHLLYEAIRTSAKTAICKVAIRARTNLAMLRIVDRCLAIETIHYPDEIRPAQHVPNRQGKAAISEQELHLAHKLIERFTKPFNGDDYIDDYRSALADLIQKKMVGEEVRVRQADSILPVMDLLTALQASLEAANSSGEPA